MNATASTKGKAKTIAGSVFEQLKNLGSSAVKSTVSEAGKIASGVPQNILKTQRGTEESMASDFAYNPERFIPKIEKPKRVKTPEMLLFSNQEREESLRINREVEMVLMEIKREILNQITPKIKEIMEHVTQLKAPLVVEAKVGKSWGEQREVTGD